MSDKQRRYRERIRAGKTMVLVEIDEVDLVFKLQQANLLPAGVENREAISAAIEKLLREWEP
jgi:hypothetical protein